MNLRMLGAALCLTSLAPTLAAAETSPASVLGKWQTEAVGRPAVDGSTAYLQTMTSFTEDKQELVLSIYGDPELKNKLFEYSSGGSWDPQGPAEGVPGALAINMRNAYSLVTIYVDAPEFWAAMGMAECPLKIGEAVDITECVQGPPFGVTDCVDLDIVMVDEDGKRLRYGGGGVDRCVVRPTELSADAYFRME